MVVEMPPEAYGHDVGREDGTTPTPPPEEAEEELAVPEEVEEEEEVDHPPHSTAVSRTAPPAPVFHQPPVTASIRNCTLRHKDQPVNNEGMEEKGEKDNNISQYRETAFVLR